MEFRVAMKSWKWPMSDESTQIAIVDYGMGNLFSVRQACERAGLDIGPALRLLSPRRPHRFKPASRASFFTLRPAASFALVNGDQEARLFGGETALFWPAVVRCRFC